jgi:hypothetical protein
VAARAAYGTIRSMSRVVHLHIGAPKTGTTYLQDRLARNAGSLADHGIEFPAGGLLTSRPLFHFRAALDLLDQDWGGPPGHAKGAWPTMARMARRGSGTAIISHEILAPAPQEKVAKVMNDLAGAEVHVVYSARDLARQLPAAWQESIKQGRAWRFERFLNAAEQGHAWFMRAFDLPTVLNHWARNLPPERVHVVTVPPSGAPEDELWLRFCRAFGIDPAWAPLDSERANESLGIVETEVLRRLNRRIERRTRREAAYDELIRELLRQEGLMITRSRKVELPPARYPWAAEQAERWIDWLKGSGVDVVGDVADLRPGLPPETWRDPDAVSRKRLANAALDALAAMTHEAAARPDPKRELTTRARTAVKRLRRR